MLDVGCLCVCVCDDISCPGYVRGGVFVCTLSLAMSKQWFCVVFTRHGVSSVGALWFGLKGGGAPRFLWGQVRRCRSPIWPTCVEGSDSAPGRPPTSPGGVTLHQPVRASNPAHRDPAAGSPPPRCLCGCPGTGLSAVSAGEPVRNPCRAMTSAGPPNAAGSSAAVRGP